MKVNLLILMIIVAFVISGCGSKELDQEAASQLAAALANKECLKLYGKQPFLPSDYEAKFFNKRWHWGRLDPSEKKGLSAEVSFKKDGSDRKAKVYFSSDEVREDLFKFPDEELEDLFRSPPKIIKEK